MSSADESALSVSRLGNTVKVAKHGSTTGEVVCSSDRVHYSQTGSEAR